MVYNINKPKRGKTIKEGIIKYINKEEETEIEDYMEKMMEDKITKAIKEVIGGLPEKVKEINQKKTKPKVKFEEKKEKKEEKRQRRTITCFICGKQGHIAKFCRNRKKKYIKKEEEKEKSDKGKEKADKEDNKDKVKADEKPAETKN